VIETAGYLVDTLSQRRGGIYYTPPPAAQAMASWAIRSNDDQVLEPCFGSGVFLAAIKQESVARGFTFVRIYGAELMPAAHTMAITTGLIKANNATLGDFLGVTPFPVKVVIGNPPYVRLRKLPIGQQQRALNVTEKALGVPMDSAGSIWMAFIVHAISFLDMGGRLALVLPYEFTHVRYAKPLWGFLGDHFGDLRVVRVRERLFPDLMQEAIILFAENRGGTTNVVTFEAYQTVRNFVDNMPIIREQIPLSEILNGGRPFVKALLPHELVQLLDTRLAFLTTPMAKSCTFNIGYVSGNKNFFHPNKQTVVKFKLPESSLRPTLTASKQLSGVGIRTSSIPERHMRQLFYPNKQVSLEETEYINYGDREGVAKGYKCSHRKPWYQVPDVRVPDLVLSVFKEVPCLMWNDRGLVASNSLLCGFVQPGYTVDQLIAAWYTSLTLLSCELRVHALGGGVLVLIPGEVATVQIPIPGWLPTTHIEDIDKTLRSKKANPYQIGDEPVLVKSLGLTTHELELIREGVQLLVNWRMTNHSVKA
jgi:adenine-specific DNA-methyltransferase